MSKLNVGGQALIEGVMMKSEKVKSIAIRKQDDTILVTSENLKQSKFSKYKKIPFLRGMFVLIESMIEGTKDINYAASFFAEDESEEIGMFEKIMVKLFKDKADKAATILSMVMAFAIAIGIFIVLPAFMVKSSNEDASIFTSLKEGLIKIGFFVAYIYIISLMNDIKRVFQYHGAEHKSIFAYERGLELTIENVKKMPRLHPRCGTNFIFVVLMVSTLVFSFFTFENVLIRSLLKLIFFPFVAGIAYEIIKIAGKHQNIFTKTLIFPGLLMQKITTREPDEKQIEVAIEALKATIERTDTGKVISI